jgi:hypothetical protein
MAGIINYLEGDRIAFECRQGNHRRDRDTPE